MYSIEWKTVNNFVQGSHTIPSHAPFLADLANFRRRFAEVRPWPGRRESRSPVAKAIRWREAGSGLGSGLGPTRRWPDAGPSVALALLALAEQAPAVPRLLLLLSLVSLVGCPRERREIGTPCGGAEECVSGLCVAGVQGDEPACTRTCASSEDCPTGWSCSGATEEGVVICLRRDATPFGQ